MGGNARQRGRRPRGCDYTTDSGGSDAILNASHFSCYESPQPFQFAFARRIVSEEFTSEPDSAERQAHRFADLSASRQRKLATAAPEVHQQHGIRIDPAIRNNAQV